jgi:hypothetical protein
MHGINRFVSGRPQWHAAAANNDVASLLASRPVALYRLARLGSSDRLKAYQGLVFRLPPLKWRQHASSNRPSIHGIAEELAGKELE